MANDSLDTLAVEIIKRHDRMAADRSNFDSQWQEIAERVLPGQANFNSKPSPGAKRTEKMVDATAALALRKFSAALDGMMTPHTQVWHRLTVGEDALADNRNVKVYFEALNKALFKARYSPSANFTGQAGQGYLGLGAFGTQPIFVDEEVGVGLRYHAVPLSGAYIAENHVGIVDTVHRMFEYTARQAEQRWGIDALPEKIRIALDKNPDDLFEFIHCVKPNGERNYGGDRTHRGMPWASYYAAKDAKVIVQQGGYRSWPFPIMRDLTTPGEVYGRSPAMWALPDIKMLNEMAKTVLRAAQRVVDPPLLATEDGLLQAFDLRAGAINYGGLDEQKRQNVQPLITNARIDIGHELMDQKREQINDSFFITVFQILAENPKMTATEVLERAQEKGVLLSPLMGRQTSEYLGPMIERELDILSHAGALPEPPPELVEAGGEYKIEYESPLARAQRAESGVAIVRTLEGLAPLLELKPELLDVFDMDEMTRELATVYGIPQRIMKDKEIIAAERAQRAKEQQTQQIVDAVPGVGRGVKDLALAEQAAA